MKIAFVALFSACMHQMCAANKQRGLRSSKAKPMENEEMPETVEITLGKSSDQYDGNVYEMSDEGSKTDFANPSIQVDTGIQSVAMLYNQESSQTVKGNIDSGIKKGSNETYRVIIQSKNEKKESIMNFLSDIALIRNIEVHHEFDEFNTVVASVCEETLKELKNHDDTQVIEHDLPRVIEEPVAVSQSSFQMFSPSSSQSVPYGINMMEGLRLRVKGSGAKVCILDDGYSMSHSDLSKNVEWITPQVDGKWSHGTHVAGTIAAMNNGHGVVGVSPNAKTVMGAFLGQNFISSTVDGIRKCR